MSAREIYDCKKYIWQVRNSDPFEHDTDDGNHNASRVRYYNSFPVVPMGTMKSSAVMIDKSHQALHPRQVTPLQPPCSNMESYLILRYAWGDTTNKATGTDRAVLYHTTWNN